MFTVRKLDHLYVTAFSTTRQTKTAKAYTTLLQIQFSNLNTILFKIPCQLPFQRPSLFFTSIIHKLAVLHPTRIYTTSTTWNSIRI